MTEIHENILATCEIIEVPWKKGGYGMWYQSMYLQDGCCTNENENWQSLSNLMFANTIIIHYLTLLQAKVHAPPLNKS